MAMTDSSTGPDPRLAVAYRKITVRILPFLFLCFVVAYMDRINVGMAKLQMQDDLALSAAAYGFGAGIFFLGYVLFEVPSNLGLERWGARATLTRIMVLWGIASGLTAFVTQPWQFYVLRFLLGAFEAGFAPGVILYLTYWYPVRMRGRAFGSFLSAAAVAGIIVSPLSGWIMEALDGALGFGGWRWMLVLEAVPAVVLGVLVTRVLSNRPQDARWLSDEDKALVAADHAGDAEAGATEHGFLSALKQPVVYLLGLAYLSIQLGVYLISFWLPTIVDGLGDYDESTVGMITMLPYIGALVGMILIGRSADRTGRYRLHVVLSATIAMIAILGTLWTSSPVLSVVLLVIAATGFFGSLPAFWPIPSACFSGFAAAGAIALINSIGTTAGFFAPYAAGMATDATGSVEIVLYGVAVVLILGFLAIFSTKRRSRVGS